MNKCTIYCDNRPIAVVEEKKKSFRVESICKTETVSAIRVDGCVLTTGKKCDYLLKFKEIDCALFVELKGNDVAEAYRQILETVVRLKGRVQGRIFGVIVSTSTPAARTTSARDIQRIKGEYSKDIRKKITWIPRTGPVFSLPYDYFNGEKRS